MWDFILARYNYWIVICLMMIGLYIVFSRGNLVKTLIGLNLFQTSVFIFYITISKVAGGTAPILIGGGKAYGDAHGAEHGEGGHAPNSVGHGDETALHDTGGGHNADTAMVNHLPSGASEPVLASGSDGARESLHGGSVSTEAGNTLYGADAAHIDKAAGAGAPDLHIVPDLIDASAAAPVAHEPTSGAAAQAAEVIYSNPLPHVLILTAIVVGVATTAVGLGLAVRIREAYGTIEEDELELADFEAEFGPSPASETAGS